MKIVLDGYKDINFEQNHITTMLIEGYGLNNTYIASQNVEEFKSVLKIGRLLGNAMYRMLPNNEVSCGFKWEKIG